MSLIVAIKSYDGGTVLAGDSRTVTIDPAQPGGYFTSDDDMKVYAFPDPHRFVGVATVGLFMSNATLFAQALPPRRLTVRQYAEYIATACVRQYATRDRAVCTPDNGGPICALVGGVDEGGDAGRLFVVRVPDAPDPVEFHAGTAGMAWVGTRTVLDQILQGYWTAAADLHPSFKATLDAAGGLEQVMHFKIPLHEFPLAACVDLADFLLRTAIGLQRFRWKQPQNIGLPVDIATITTRSGFGWIRRKALRLPGAEPTLLWHVKEEWTPIEVTVSTPADFTQIATYSVRPQ